MALGKSISINYSNNKCIWEVFKGGWDLEQPGMVGGVPVHGRTWNGMGFELLFHPKALTKYRFIFSS